MKLKRIGVDLAKSVFQVHGVDSHEQVQVRKQLRRSQMLDFFRQVESPCVVAMEACGSAHYWGRELIKLGHEVRLISPQFTYGLGERSTRPIGRVWSGDAGQRRGGMPALDGVAYAIAEVLEDGENGLPGLMRRMLFQLSEELTQRDQQIGELDELIKQQCKADERIKRLLEIDGIGPISASAVVAAIGDAKQFTGNRDLSAWVGLVPRQYSSGGKEQLGHITKRGDTYLRTLLIHGARAVVNACQNKTDRKSKWLQGLITRRNKNIATVALANKNARIIWAVLTRGESYRPG